jgi:head-tail adaptor
VAAYRAKTGDYNLRVVVQRRSVGAKQSNGEDLETWPDPDAGTNEYFAAREALNAGEEILQGIRNSTGTMKLRVKGRAIPLDARDRVKVKHTGEVFEITGVVRDGAETVLTVERLRSQTTQQ